MAIDTADKRSSAINVASPWRGLLPLPDGTIDGGDFAHAAYMYRGLAAEAGADETPLGLLLVLGVGV